MVIQTPECRSRSDAGPKWPSPDRKEPVELGGGCNSRRMVIWRWAVGKYFYQRSASGRTRQTNEGVQGLLHCDWRGCFASDMQASNRCAPPRAEAGMHLCVLGREGSRASSIPRTRLVLTPNRRLRAALCWCRCTVARWLCSSKRCAKRRREKHVSPGRDAEAQRTKNTLRMPIRGTVVREETVRMHESQPLYPKKCIFVLAL